MGDKSNEKGNVIYKYVYSNILNPCKVIIVGR